MHVYIPLKPHESGHPQGGGYKCGACGLEGLSAGEPHYRSTGIVCEPAVSGLAPTHPQYAFSGHPIRVRANPIQGSGHLLERQNDAGEWTYDDLQPKVNGEAPAPSEKDRLFAAFDKLPTEHRNALLSNLESHVAPPAPVGADPTTLELKNADGTPITIAQNVGGEPTASPGAELIQPVTAQPD